LYDQFHSKIDEAEFCVIMLWKFESHSFWITYS